ncbi:hypothetical protein GCM10010423_64890 [Streptomyces levis]|uniref:Uncharacterized protein n=1 Tax=Streptomyces levis TaxID=285566 RepID=A0ABP6BHB9_9ACTN
MSAEVVNNALSLLDEVFGPMTPKAREKLREQRNRAVLKGLGFFFTTMGGVQTKGCTRRGCGGTMYKTYERNGNGSQWVCNTCGKVD